MFGDFPAVFLLLLVCFHYVDQRIYFVWSQFSYKIFKFFSWFYDPEYDLSWWMLHTYMKRMYNLLGRTFCKCQLNSVPWWHSVLYLHHSLVDLSDLPFSSVSFASCILKLFGAYAFRIVTSFFMDWPFYNYLVSLSDPSNPLCSEVFYLPLQFSFDWYLLDTYFSIHLLLIYRYNYI